MTSPWRKIPSVAADILARAHYGLPLQPGHLTGNSSKGYRSCLSRLRSIGHLTGNSVTEQGYRYLHETIHKIQRERRYERESSNPYHRAEEARSAD